MCCAGGASRITTNELLRYTSPRPPGVLGTSPRIHQSNPRGKGHDIGHSLFCLSDFLPSCKSLT